MLVVQQGLACLQQGAGPIEAMVVRADPTLDEMLAATLAGELLGGRPLPAAAERSLGMRCGERVDAGQRVARNFHAGNFQSDPHPGRR